MKKNNLQLDKFYQKEVLKMLDGMKENVLQNLCPRVSAVGLMELTENWTRVKIELSNEKTKTDDKIRIKGSRADRRSGKSIKKEGKVSKSKAKTKEVRSSKKYATIRKRGRS